MRLGRKALERLRDALSKPPRLAADEAGDRPGFGFHLHGLSAQGTRDVTGGGGASRDALIAALHLTIARWNSRHEMPGRRIGVLVPVDLRPGELPEHVVANLSVNTRLSTTPRERATPASALRAIAWHSKRDKATRTGIALIAALQRAGMLALWAKQSSIVLQPLIEQRPRRRRDALRPRLVSGRPALRRRRGRGRASCGSPRRAGRRAACAWER